MSDSALGKIGWLDLTVPDADSVSQFYQAVAGWTRSAVEMEGYSDFCMHPPGIEHPVAGICHARGNNAGLPAQWLMYITVANLAGSLAACRAGGGEVIREPGAAGEGQFAVIRDPAGAICALYQSS